MNKLCCFVFAAGFSWLALPAQDVLNANKEFLPDRSDTTKPTREFQYYLAISYAIPSDETNEVQAKRLGDNKTANRPVSARMEMLWYVPWWKENHSVEPHLGVRAEGYPTLGYAASRMFLGFSIRPNASVGAFSGSYYRRVASDGNFVNRRSQQFDNYSLFGGYLQASDKNIAMLFAVAFEKREPVFVIKMSSRIGETLRLRGFSRSLQIDFSREEFTGPAIGFSFEPTSKLRTQFLFVNPDNRVRNDQARLGNKLTSGVLVSASVYVN
jgi:hypothetical protein